MYIYLHTSFFFFIIFGWLGLLKISKDDVHRYVNNKKNTCLFREIFYKHTSCGVTWSNLSNPICVAIVKHDALISIVR